MKLTNFFDAFPTPKFLDIPFAGVSITDTFVNCIQFVKNGNDLSILKYAERPIPPGVITLGQVNDESQIKLILQNLKKDLKLDFVKISLPEEKAYLFSEKIPIVENSEIHDVVESKIEENVPVSPSELIFDYQLVKGVENDHLDVVVSAIPIDVVNTYVHMSEEANLSLIALGIESQAIARAVLPKGTNSAVLVVHFGQEKVGLYVVVQGVVRFTSTVSSKSSSSDGLDILSQEIKKLYVYWHTLSENAGKPERKISQIIICGENFPENTVSHLNTSTHTQVIIGDVWANVFDIDKVIPPIDFGDSLRYATAIGLALPADVLL